MKDKEKEKKGAFALLLTTLKSVVLLISGAAVLVGFLAALAIVIVSAIPFAFMYFMLKIYIDYKQKERPNKTENKKSVINPWRFEE